MSASPRMTRNLAEVIRAKLAKDSKLAAAVEEELFGFNVSEELFRARKEARLTQRQVADSVGTHQSVISRMEDADYSGHTLAMLRKIAAAVGKRLEVRFVDLAPSGTEFDLGPLAMDTPEWESVENGPWVINSTVFRGVGA